MTVTTKVRYDRQNSRSKVFPELKQVIGDTLITDGTSLLGADD